MSTATQPAEIDFRRSRGGELSAILALFRLTIRQHIHGRRIIVLGLLYLLPCGLAILLRYLPHPPRPDELEFALILNLLPHAFAPLTALLYAASTVQDEVEDQTMTYLLMRSIPRWALYVTKLAATWCVTTALMVIATVMLYASIYGGTPEFNEILRGRMLTVLGITALAQFTYCTVFGLIGLAARRSLIVGLVFIVVIEGVFANLEFILRNITVVHYVRTLYLRWIEFPDRMMRDIRDWNLTREERLPDGGREYFIEAPTAEEAVWRLVIAGVVLLAFSAWWFSRKEFRVKTPEGS